MKLQIKEFAALVGVSVRTLHYYDEIGLLAPASVDAQSGYRYYDDASLARMQEILFYRELDFPLKEIAALLASPNYDKAQALAAQKELLILKRDRLDRLITAIDSAEKGVIDMNAFDNSAFEAKRDAYAAEAKERWGASDAWQEHEMKTKNYSSEKWQTLSAEMDTIFADFAAAMTQGLAPESNDAQALAKRKSTISRCVSGSVRTSSRSAARDCASAKFASSQTGSGAFSSGTSSRERRRAISMQVWRAI